MIADGAAVVELGLARQGRFIEAEQGFPGLFDDHVLAGGILDRLFDRQGVDPDAEGFLGNALGQVRVALVLEFFDAVQVGPQFQPLALGLRDDHLPQRLAHLVAGLADFATIGGVERPEQGGKALQAIAVRLFLVARTFHQHRGR
ncbi:hypothetical protein D3C81_1466110 [compost metagenome]